MSVFVSQQDFITSQEECEKVHYSICGHNYDFWCKKNKVEDVKYIFDKVSTIIEKNNSKHIGFSFDKILFMSLIDILAKEKQVEDKKDFEKLKQEQQTKELVCNENYIDDVVEILKILGDCIK